MILTHLTQRPLVPAHVTLSRAGRPGTVAIETTGGTREVYPNGGKGRRPVFVMRHFQHGVRVVGSEKARDALAAKDYLQVASYFLGAVSHKQRIGG